jgi:MFS family permease
MVPPGHGGAKAKPQEEESVEAAELSLSARDRRVVLELRARGMLSTTAYGLAATAILYKKLHLFGHDYGQMALAAGQVSSMVSLGNLCLGPIIGSLSDRFGRKALMAMPVVGQLLYFFSMATVKSVERYQELAVLSLGVLSAGSVGSSALDDVFSTRPRVSAAVQASNAAWLNGVGLLAPLVGAELGRRSSATVALGLAFVVAALQLPLLLCSAETLEPGQRRTFQLAKADPLRNIGLLFTHGARLRRLALSNVLFLVSAKVNLTMQPYQIGFLGFRASDSPRYGSFSSLLGIASSGWLIRPMVRRLGPARAFRAGSCFSAAGHLLISQAWRPLGGSKARHVAQLVLAMVVMLPAHACGLCMRTMLVSSVEGSLGGQPQPQPQPRLLPAAAAATAAAEEREGHLLEAKQQRRRRWRRSRPVPRHRHAKIGYQHQHSVGRGEINAAIAGLAALVRTGRWHHLPIDGACLSRQTLLADTTRSHRARVHARVLAGGSGRAAVLGRAHGAADQAAAWCLGVQPGGAVCSRSGRQVTHGMVGANLIYWQRDLSPSWARGVCI